MGNRALCKCWMTEIYVCSDVVPIGQTTRGKG